MKEICIEISDRFEINFLEIGTDDDHVHFLVQSIPTLSVEKIVRTIKSILARIVLFKHPEIKEELWGGSFWTSGYYANTVGQYGNEETIKRYVEKQGKEYNQVYDGQLNLF
jgi:REP element-mobilizing transposase RayT